MICAILHMLLFTTLPSWSRRRRETRELKIETFSGRRRPDWKSKPGTEVAVASRQNSNIKIAVNTQKDGALEDYR